MNIHDAEDDLFARGIGRTVEQYVENSSGGSAPKIDKEELYHPYLRVGHKDECFAVHIRNQMLYTAIQIHPRFACGYDKDAVQAADRQALAGGVRDLYGVIKFGAKEERRNGGFDPNDVMERAIKESFTALQWIFDGVLVRPKSLLDG